MGCKRRKFSKSRAHKQTYQAFRTFGLRFKSRCGKISHQDVSLAVLGKHVVKASRFGRKKFGGPLNSPEICDAVQRFRTARFLLILGNATLSFFYEDPSRDCGKLVTA